MSDEVAPGDQFASAEGYYARYRPPYPDAAVREVAARVDLDGTGRSLDLGCGTGRLAVAVAAHAGDVLGMDPNRAMLEHARERAAEAGVENVRFTRGAAADLGGEGPLRLTTVGRAFHRMDPQETLARLFRMTEPGGGVALFGDTEWLTRGTAAWQAAVYDVASEFVADLPDRTGPVTYAES